MGLYQTRKLLHSKENHQQNERATYGMGENVCKPYIQRVKCQKYIRNSYNAVANKQTKPELENEQRTWIDIFFQRNDTDVPKVYLCSISGKHKSKLQWAVYLILISISIIKKTRDNKCSWGCGVKGIFAHC